MQLKRIKAKAIQSQFLIICLLSEYITKKLMKSNVVKTNSQKVGICAITLFQRRRSCNV